MLGILLTLIVVFYLADLWRKTTRLPPGPFPVLFLGNLPQLAFYSRRYGGIVPAFKRLKEIYGPVFTVWLGPIATVHIANYALGHEAMVRSGAKYEDRWSPAIMYDRRGNRGLLVSSGMTWKEQRRHSSYVLRNLGVSRNLIEERIMDEFNLRFEEIDHLPSDTPVDPFHLFDRLIGGIINRILFSTPINGEEEMKFYKYRKDVDRFFEQLPFDYTFIKSWMLKIPILSSRWTKMLEPMHKMEEFIRMQVAERRRAVEDGSHVIDAEPKDYTDAFLQKIDENAKEGIKDSSFDEESLAISIMDLWVAGQETTSSVVCWAMIFLLRNPQVATSIRKEVQRATGGSRPLSLTDKPQTPYLLASITEILRLASVLNMNLFRKTDSDTEIGGHPVPKDTVVTIELSLVLSDENKFPNPDVFDPSRYISDPSLTSAVIAFGLGKRSCIAEALARAELYLVIGNILLRYTLKCVDGPPIVEELNKDGIFRKPKHFEMIFNKFI
ncbi:unnamed protein product [Cylicocyclus nassatus]|uniref:Unspecific monooxygenase n=1 Tax=Cylicocyclus nassatus TaxID=53992 RepID=A0AA36M951_CYLNA|nr:unnamed protein product [Cylicocyclus nassatus]